MSLLVPKFDESVIIRDAEAEVAGRAPTTVQLPADSSATGGATSSSPLDPVTWSSSRRACHDNHFTKSPVRDARGR